MKRTIIAAIALLVFATAAHAAIFKNWKVQSIGHDAVGMPTVTIYNAQGQIETFWVSWDQWIAAANHIDGFCTVYDMNGDSDTLDGDIGDGIYFGVQK